MAAFLFIAHKRRIRSRIDELRLMHLATKGKSREVKEQADRWQKES